MLIDYTARGGGPSGSENAAGSPEVYCKYIVEVKWTGVRCRVNPCAGASVKGVLNV